MYCQPRETMNHLEAVHKETADILNSSKGSCIGLKAIIVTQRGIVLQTSLEPTGIDLSYMYSIHLIF